MSYCCHFVILVLTRSRPRVKLVSVAGQSNLMSNSIHRFYCGMACDHVVIFIMVIFFKISNTIIGPVKQIYLA